MSIEFSKVPPEDANDVGITYPFEDSASRYTTDGFDPVGAQIGEADASELLKSIVEHLPPDDSMRPIDYELMRAIIHEAAEKLDDTIKESYVRGAIAYIDKLEKADVSNPVQQD